MAEHPTEVGYVGRIPVRNLWLLMLYASDLYRHRDVARVAVEDNPDDIPELVAEILTRLVERRLKRNLSYAYQSREAVTSRVRGRIDLMRTERHRLLDRGLIACRFDELTVDTPRNRFVRGALDEMAGVVGRPELSRRCRSLAASLRRLGVNGECPGRTDVTIGRFGRHDIADQPMVAAAQLAFDLALPTEGCGSLRLLSPERDVVWIRRLYEKGIAGFYDVALPSMGWRVDQGKSLSWPIDHKSAGIDAIFPSMRTDVVLDNMVAERRILVDTKFNAIIARGWHREETLRSGYIYQIYAYLRSQEGRGDPMAETASGLLLHPSIGQTVNEAVVIQGHEIRFATIDLAGDAKEIRRSLLELVGAVAHRPS